MPTVHDNAICIRRLDWSETSQIVVLLSQAHGKISATAKGAKRQNPSALAKFSGGIDLLSMARAVLILKPKESLANLIEWDLVEPFWHLRNDLGAYQLSMYAADLVHHLVQDHDPHPRTFDALAQLLGDLAEPSQRPAALMRFHWEMISDLGYRPVLDRDAVSGQALPESSSYGFSAQAGGLVADTGGADRWRVRAETVRLLRQMSGENLTQHDSDAWGRANRLMCVYLRSILDRQLPTMRYILTESD